MAAAGIPTPPQGGTNGMYISLAGSWDGEATTTRLFWQADTCDFTVILDSSGAVTMSGACPQKRLEQSPLDNLIWRAKRQWRRWFP
jgi:hypothetical protein